jgi:molybdate transport system substrate-binding protein
MPKISIRYHGLLLFSLVLGFASLSGCKAQKQTQLTLSVASSMKDAVAEIETNYKVKNTSVDFRNNFGSSGTLAHEIENGAPVDIFMSAAAKPMDRLESEKLIADGTRRNLVRNTLVLIAPRDSRLKNFAGLADSSVRTIAVGDPATVPAGQYGQQTLVALKLADKIGKKKVMAKDVRQVLTYVETGNADAGLVYATDAKISAKVQIVAEAPESSHDAIVYPVAVVKGSRNKEAASNFAAYLASPEAQAVFIKYGFTIASR